MKLAQLYLTLCNPMDIVHRIPQARILEWEPFTSPGESSCEAARANTMTGGLDLSLDFPRNGKIPYPHQATWSQPINMRPVRKRESIRGKLKSP